MTEHTNYVVCVENAGHPASLELRKIYQLLPDPRAEQDGFLRVIDESGEDYLYPSIALRRFRERPPATNANGARANGLPSW